MNNSKFVIENISLSQEEPIDREPVLRERESELIKILDAIRKVASTDEWHTLKVQLFDSFSENLVRQIQEEARKENPNPLRLRYLSGQLNWAEKFSDLQKLEQQFRVEIINIRSQLTK